MIAPRLIDATFVYAFSSLTLSLSHIFLQMNYLFFKLRQLVTWNHLQIDLYIEADVQQSENTFFKRVYLPVRHFLSKIYSILIPLN